MGERWWPCRLLTTGGLGLPRKATKSLCGTAELQSVALPLPARALPQAKPG